MNHAQWITHFLRNRGHRTEPDWMAPVKVPQAMLASFVRSLEQFRLGDGGGPASLIAFDAEHFRGSSNDMRAIVDFWFKEEAEHARLLGCAVKRFGGRIITSHWSFTAFCWVRRIFGVRCELQVLLLTELVSTAYYWLLRMHSPDKPVADMCSLILRDEAGHVAFHRDRLADAGFPRQGWRGKLWRTQFWLFGYAAATMLWINHAACLKAIGSSRQAYFEHVRRQLGSFLASLERLRKSRAILSVLALRPNMPEPAQQDNICAGLHK